MSKGESFADLFEREASDVPRARTLNVGDRIEGVVAQVGRDGVFVELDGKRQAFLGREELLDPDGEMRVKAGDRVEATIVEITGSEVKLGRSLRTGNLEMVQQAHEAGLAVEGKVTGLNKGGLEVDLGGVRGFCPMSQIDRGFVESPEEYVGRSLRFEVTELRDGKNAVLSRRRVLEREAQQASDRVLSNLSPGTRVQGKVTGVREFGAFVDLGGIEGLVPTSQLSYDRSARPDDVLTPGDVVEVEVLSIEERERKRPRDPGVRITLSLKSLAQDPWDGIDTVAPEGKVVMGTVQRLEGFGAFVQLVPGVEGLLHVSELGGAPSHPSQVLAVGQSLAVVVKRVDRAERKLSLAPAPDSAAPGSTVRGPHVAIGALVEGKVDRIEPFGVFVQLSGTKGRSGRGLIPNAELGVQRGTDIRKAFPPGTEVKAQVLETGEGKLKLSIRAAKESAERAEFEGYRERDAAPEKLGTLGDLLKKKLKG